MRASDRDRERAATQLSRGCAGGEISVETLEQRLELAYRAKTRPALRALTADLRGLGSWLRRTAVVLGLRRPDHEVTVEPPPGPAASDPLVIVPPPATPEGDGLLIGRGSRCNLVLDDPTVSRRHAELQREDQGWLLTDLGSTNGTWVNGWRVDRAFVHDGDRIFLGGLAAVFSGEAHRPPLS